MSAVMELEEPIVLDNEADATLAAVQAVMDSNYEAKNTLPESLQAFIELVMAADPEYIEAPEYTTLAPEDKKPLDWDQVSEALNESQEILVLVQKLLTETFLSMGLPDAQYLRVWQDMDGSLRLTGDHERREEIERELNGPANAELRRMYEAAVSGMSMAGGLVGTMACPEEVLRQVRDSQNAPAA